MTRPPYAASAIQLPAKRADHSAAEDGALVWDRATQRPEMSRAGAFVPLGDAFAYGKLQADYTLANTTAVQKLFNWSANGALTLPTGAYLFDMALRINTMSTTSGNGQISLGGSATLVRILQAFQGGDSAALNIPDTWTFSTSLTASSDTNVVTATIQANLNLLVRGVFDVTVVGTVIPQIALTTAITTALVKTGSYFCVQRLGAAGVATSGAWS